MRNQNNYKYSHFSSLKDIQAEKERLRRKIRKQEKILDSDWKRIENSWKVVGKITGVVGNLFTSASLLGSMELGYKIFSFLFSKKSFTPKDST